MRVGGFQKLTLVDYPGKVAATVFTQGCNFRCGFCHNPELVCPERFQLTISTKEVLDYLKTRQGKLEGVVITGGEPTLQKGLADFIISVRQLGFSVKLDTNGSRPEVLCDLIGLQLIDYIAMDVKTSLEKYSQVTNCSCDTDKIRESISLIINSGLPYQFRTTLVKEFCRQEDLFEIQKLIGPSSHYVLQPFIFSPKMVGHNLFGRPQYTNVEIEILKTEFNRLPKNNLAFSF